MFILSQICVALKTKKERVLKQVWLSSHPSLLSGLKKSPVDPAHLMAGHPAY